MRKWNFRITSESGHVGYQKKKDAEQTIDFIHNQKKEHDSGSIL